MEGKVSKAKVLTETDTKKTFLLIAFALTAFCFFFNFTPSLAVIREKADAPTANASSGKETSINNKDQSDTDTRVDSNRMESKSTVGSTEDSTSAEHHGVIPVRPGDTHVSSVIVTPGWPIDVSIWTDRRSYIPGDPIRILFSTNRDAHIYIFNIDTRGRTHQIFPNFFDKDNFVEGGWRYRIPDRSYELIVSGPAGREDLKIIAVPERCHFWERRYTPTHSAPYPIVRGGVEEFLRDFQFENEESDVTQNGLHTVRKVKPNDSSKQMEYKDDSHLESLRVRPVPQPHPRRHYAIAYTSFYVRNIKPDYPPYYEYWGEEGTLKLSTSPSGASVFVNDEYMGKTPVKVDLPEGQYDLRFEKSGYRPWYQSARVLENRTTNIRARLERFRRR